MRKAKSDVGHVPERPAMEGTGGGSRVSTGWSPSYRIYGPLRADAGAIEMMPWVARRVPQIGNPSRGSVSTQVSKDLDKIAVS